MPDVEAVALDRLNRAAVAIEQRGCGDDELQLEIGVLLDRVQCGTNARVARTRGDDDADFSTWQGGYQVKRDCCAFSAAAAVFIALTRRRYGTAFIALATPDRDRARPRSGRTTWKNDSSAWLFTTPLRVATRRAREPGASQLHAAISRQPA